MRGKPPSCNVIDGVTVLMTAAIGLRCKTLKELCEGVLMLSLFIGVKKCPVRSSEMAIKEALKKIQVLI